MHPLDTPVADLGYAAKKRADLLVGMGLRTVRDLLLRFPRRQEEYLDSARISEVEPDMHVSIVARVVKSANRRSFKRRMTITEASLEDGTGKIGALWFNQPYAVKTLAPGRAFRFTGKATKTKYGLRIINPRYEPVSGSALDVADEDEDAPTGESSKEGLMPVYPVTAGISQNVMRMLMKLALPSVALLEDPLPEKIRKSRKLMKFADAVRAAHEPSDEAAYADAKKRLGFDEVLRLQLSLGRLRRLRASRPAPVVPYGKKEGKLIKDFVGTLPFKLTEDQRVAADRALKDMAKGRQMHRLLDGDVGSGKTVVAAIAMLNAAGAGFQSALMAPTEILAFQHFSSLSKFFAKQPFAVALWTNSYKRVMRGGKEIVCANKMQAVALGDEIASGEIAIVIGTHALIEETLRFRSLALAVVDEQHRFGVRMRSLLAGKSGMPGLEPHLLSMTATPIPRTLALSVFGDLDLSLLKEKPIGRLEIETRLVSRKDRSRAYDKVRDEIGRGRQAFIVCPLIDPSDILGVTSVTEEYDRLRKEDLVGIPIGVLHGKLASAQKEKVMADFLAKKLMVIVSTSVIEVGVDVPNASVMCIEGAERFGLSQLHQFRGRVGRGAHRSYCFLLPGSMAPQVRTRLEAVVKHHDGFALAEKDLELRGPGDVLGTAQSGFPELAFASLADAALISDAKEAAEEILADDPELDKHPALRAAMQDGARDAHLE